MGFLKSTYNFFRHPYLPDSRGFWIGLSIAVPLAGIGLSAGLWGWLNADESAGTTIRNVGLIIAALTALPIAVWRSIVADKQSAASQSQADSAQRSLRNERYQKGAEMLGHERLSVRLGGIYALQRVAEEYPQEYYVQIMRLLSAFARHPTRDPKLVEALVAGLGLSQIREDVQAVLQAISKRNTRNIDLERQESIHLDLSSAHLTSGDLQDAELSFSILQKAILHRTNLADAILTGANLTGVIGLTQAQLDRARADPNDPPKLEGVQDAETHQPLVWNGGRGAPLKD